VSAPRFLLATRSAGKLRELRPLFAEVGIQVEDLDGAGIAEHPAEEDALEAFATFEENALAKARYFFERSGGVPTIADDSGLEVAALGGAPGVRSKRWTGRPDLDGAALDAANNARLLEALHDQSDRRARYVCVAALVSPRGELVTRGETDGVITTEARGDGGFGYDPIFFFPPLNATFGEVPAKDKHAVSHRGIAARAARALLGG